MLEKIFLFLSRVGEINYLTIDKSNKNGRECDYIVKDTLISKENLDYYAGVTTSYYTRSFRLLLCRGNTERFNEETLKEYLNKEFKDMERCYLSYFLFESNRGGNLFVKNITKRIVKSLEVKVTFP